MHDISRYPNSKNYHKIHVIFKNPTIFFILFENIIRTRKWVYHRICLKQKQGIGKTHYVQKYIIQQLQYI